MNKFVLGAAVAALAMCASQASAQAVLSREDAAKIFGMRDRILDISLSPSGKKIVMVQPGPEQATVVTVMDLTKNTTTPVNFADGKPMTIRTCNWAAETRLVCRLYGVTTINDGILRDYSRMLALDPDGKNAKSLTAVEKSQKWVQSSDGYVIDWRDGQTESVLLAREYVPGADMGFSGATSMAEGLGVDLLDTRSGKVSHIESPDRTAMSYISDGQGHIRVIATDEAYVRGYETKGITTYRYRLADSRDWKPFSTFNRYTDEGMAPIAVDGSANVAYALRKTNGRFALFRIALDGSMKEELALANPNVDIDGVVKLGRRGRVVGGTYSDDKPRVQYFDAQYGELVSKLAKALPKLPAIRIEDSNADETVHIVHAASDTNAGRYYLFDTVAKKLTPIGENRPDLAGVALGAMRPIVYTAADGTKIPAYLTTPANSTLKGLPTIVMPHGGPASRDEWGFDYLVQFFVSRGYAVLQPNYRGSAGYGEDWFQKNGYRSWKIAIGDVNDAGRWLVKEGIADPSKLAIVGWSYGGYAALQSQVLDADLFKAIVAIAPVTDLAKLRASRFSKVARNDVGEGAQLKEGSPLQYPQAFKAPILMFHGDKDLNVDVDHSRDMEKALKRAGKKVTLVVYPNNDHQLPDGAIRADMLTKADAFLGETLGIK